MSWKEKYSISYEYFRLHWILEWWWNKGFCFYRQLIQTSYRKIGPNRWYIWHHIVWWNIQFVMRWLYLDIKLSKSLYYLGRGTHCVFIFQMYKRYHYLCWPKLASETDVLSKIIVVWQPCGPHLIWVPYCSVASLSCLCIGWG